MERETGRSTKPRSLYSLRGIIRISASGGKKRGKTRWLWMRRFESQIRFVEKKIKALSLRSRPNKRCCCGCSVIVFLCTCGLTRDTICRRPTVTVLLSHRRASVIMSLPTSMSKLTRENEVLVSCSPRHRRVCSCKLAPKDRFLEKQNSRP